MTQTTQQVITDLLQKSQKEILTDWMQEQMDALSLRLDLMSEKDLKQQSTEFLNLFVKVLQADNFTDIQADEFQEVRDFLTALSTNNISQGFSSSETALFIFSLKQPLFTLLSTHLKDKQEILMDAVWKLTILLDKLGLYTIEQYQKGREDVIGRQQQEMLELSTPVAKLWEGILILPLIGTLDSMRTQQVMESLLQKIVETNSTVAIIDIAGIPTVDTLVAQHLIKTVTAARLMGAHCIVSGIRPQIAQTMVHLGISLQEITTKASLADAVAFALQKANFIVKQNT